MLFDELILWVIAAVTFLLGKTRSDAASHLLADDPESLLRLVIISLPLSVPFR